jgi:hypothetical protein
VNWRRTDDRESTACLRSIGVRYVWSRSDSAGASPICFERPRSYREEEMIRPIAAVFALTVTRELDRYKNEKQ